MWSLSSKVLILLASISTLATEVAGNSNPRYTWTWGKRIQAKPSYSLDYEEYDEKANLNGYYPFAETDKPIPPPVIRPDGTTKSRVPQDTLLREQEPHFEGGFTSLDQHLRERSKEVKTNSIERSVSGLEPEEVYYADDDLLIIKGGGFPNPTYEEPQQALQKQEEIYVPPHSDIFPSPPSPHNEYNGNIPTIVKPPTAFWRTPVAASHYSPFALFIPARLFPSNRNSYFPARIFPSDSNSYYLYVPYLPPSPYNYITAPHHQSYLSKWTKPSSQLTSNRPILHPNRVSYVGDTDVNYLDPKPSVDPDAELISPVSRPYGKPYRETYQKPRNSYKKTIRPQL